MSDKITCAGIMVGISEGSGSAGWEMFERYEIDGGISGRISCAAAEIVAGIFEGSGSTGCPISFELDGVDCQDRLSARIGCAVIVAGIFEWL